MVLPKYEGPEVLALHAGVLHDLQLLPYVVMLCYVCLQAGTDRVQPLAL